MRKSEINTINEEKNQKYKTNNIEKKSKRLLFEMERVFTKARGAYLYLLASSTCFTMSTSCGSLQPQI